MMMMMMMIHEIEWVLPALTPFNLFLNGRFPDPGMNINAMLMNTKY
jgi:hypothetical protein